MRTLYIFGILCVFMIHNALASESNLLKKGLYKSLGYTTGYHRYGEFDNNNAHFMHLDMLFVGVVGEIGAVFESGIKLNGMLGINFAAGLYTGHELDVENPNRYNGSLGARVYALTGSLTADTELKAGYNLLRFSEKSSLYLQTGLGYYFIRTEFVQMDRLQGYLYVPLEFEGEALLNNTMALNYGGGYRHLIFGNHFSAASKYGVEDDMSVTQKRGFGLSAFVGARFRTKNGDLRNIKLVYEYWNIGVGADLHTTISESGAQVSIHEPKNSTHRLFLQYHFVF